MADRRGLFHEVVAPRLGVREFRRARGRAAVMTDARTATGAFETVACEARPSVLVMGHGSVLLAESLQVALHTAGVDATTICDDDGSIAVGATMLLVCDALAAEHVEDALRVMGVRRGDVTILALEDAVLPDADVQLPSAADIDDVIRVMRDHVALAAVDPGGTRAASLPGGDAFARLTEREVQVTTLLSDGDGNAAIATRLGISINTVRTHVQNVYAKLGVASRMEVAGLCAHHRHRLPRAIATDGAR